MGRPKRDFLNGHLYHIIQRGHNQNFIYQGQADKLSFFKILKDIQQKESLVLLYYVLLDNHYHLLVEAGEASMGGVFQKINQAYSRYFNRKYEHNGTIYGSKYKAFHVGDMRYLVTLLTYIAGNPIRAGIVNYPEQYPWSAHSDIVKNKPSLIDRNRLFSRLGFSESEGLNNYLVLMNEQFARNEHCEKHILD